MKSNTLTISRCGLLELEEAPTTVDQNAASKKITFSSGNQVESSPFHKFPVLRNDSYLEWVTSSQLEPGDKILVKIGGYAKLTNKELIKGPYGHFNEKSYFVPTKTTIELARWLGMFHADGSVHSRGIRIACNALEEDWREVKTLTESLFSCRVDISDNKKNCRSVCISSSFIKRWLDINGWLKPKSKVMYLPKSIRTFSAENLRAFIQGYWAADGSSSATASYIDTASEVFARQLITVFRSLGSDAALSTKTSGLGSPMFRVRWVKLREGVKPQPLPKL